MIARIRMLLPLYLSIKADDALPPITYAEGEYGIKIYPPCTAAVDPRDIEGLSAVPLHDAMALLKPAEPRFAIDLIKVNGSPTVQANLLQIDFSKPTFDRRHFVVSKPEEIETVGDPPLQFVFLVANIFLGQMRAVTRGSQVRTLRPHSTAWRLVYLSDDERELPEENGLYRQRFHAGFSWTVIAVHTAVWDKVHGLARDFRPATWDTLLLDAEALLPEIGASIVVVNAALETFIAWALDELSQLTGLKAELWQWINNRDDWYKEPSVTEQYDELLRILTGKSLMDKSQLWEALQNLRSVRNSFTHEGRPVLGGKELTFELASSLIGRAKEIVDWVELLLPESLRRPKLDRSTNIEMVKPFTGPVEPRATP